MEVVKTPLLYECITAESLYYFISIQAFTSVQANNRIWHRTHKDRVLNTKETYLPQRDKWQGLRGKDRRQRVSKKEKGTKLRGDIFPKGQRTASG